ncbi:GNAT family N-acetyltransferase [Chromobacterium sphagni]|uniref:N-acetyltransferase domain-containing protein n=1 Tax=Chromobacterium sphagni TaxID=1903179 RepID=A0ABX3CAT6_9NEIS|nr:GNAT family N-acetyltransferase [Chromobacterium sphagni]OHX19399.1 hypothetical protein BI344_09300 [Chromobacterium sphagni]
MLIRQAEPRDIDAVCRLAAQINRQHHLALPALFRAEADAAADRAFWTEVLDGDGRTMLLAEIDGLPAGFATLQLLTPSLPFLLPRRICKLNTLVVDEARRRAGVGSALLRAAKDWARASQADEIRLEVMQFNQAAQGFYARHGMAAQSQILSTPLFAREGAAE